MVNLSVQPGLSEVQAEVRAMIPPEDLPLKEDSGTTFNSPVPAKKTETPEPEAEDSE